MKIFIEIEKKTLTSEYPVEVKTTQSMTLKNVGSASSARSSGKAGYKFLSGGNIYSSKPFFGFEQHSVGVNAALVASSEDLGQASVVANHYEDIEILIHPTGSNQIEIIAKKPFTYVMLKDLIASRVRIVNKSSGQSSTVDLLDQQLSGFAGESIYRTELLIPVNGVMDSTGTYRGWVNIFQWMSVRQVGKIKVGNLLTLGEIDYGITESIIDYSSKDYNVFGDISIIERGFSSEVSFSIKAGVLSTRIISGLFEDLINKSTVFALDNGRIVFGYLVKYNVVYDKLGESVISVVLESKIQN